MPYTHEESRRRWTTTAGGSKNVPQRDCCASPGGSLSASGVTIYTVGTVKEIPGIRTYVAVDGGMVDTCGRWLYARSTRPTSRTGWEATACTTVAGMHCSPATSSYATCRSTTRGGANVLVIPATGAYGHAMANNYNALPGRR